MQKISLIFCVLLAVNYASSHEISRREASPEPGFSRFVGIVCKNHIGPDVTLPGFCSSLSVDVNNRFSKGCQEIAKKICTVGGIFGSEIKLCHQSLMEYVCPEEVNEIPLPQSTHDAIHQKIHDHIATCEHNSCAVIRGELPPHHLEDDPRLSRKDFHEKVGGKSEESIEEPSNEIIDDPYNEIIDEDYENP